jgi:hypothetical protein
MPVSPVPIYLGCACLIVGGLGLGAQHMLGGNTVVSATNSAPQPPLFAQSVEQASLPAEKWASQRRDVAHHEAMVQLLTRPVGYAAPSAAPAAPQADPSASSREAQAAGAAQEVPRAAPREVVRDLAKPTRRPSKRTRDARAKDAAAEPADLVDRREARAQRRRPELDDRRRREGEPRVFIL